jgi:hypothetical protein
LEKLLKSVFLFLACVVAVAAQARPVGYVISADSPDSEEADRLFQVDLGTGAAVSRGALPTIYEDVEGLALDAHGILYGIDDATKSLVRVDPATAVVTVPGGSLRNTRLPASLSEIDDPGLAFACDGRLLMSSTRGRLYELNVTTGLATLIGGPDPALALNITDLAVRGAVVYGLGHSELHRIDPVRGTSTPIGRYGNNIQFNGGGGLAFDEEGGLWAVADRSPSGATMLYRIDSATGVATAAGSIAIKGIDSLTLAPTQCTSTGVSGAGATPIPAVSVDGSLTILLLVTGVGLMALKGRSSSGG